MNCSSKHWNTKPSALTRSALSLRTTISVSKPLTHDGDPWCFL